MKQTKFSISIYKPTPVLNDLCQIVAKHNGGESLATLDLFLAAVAMKKFEYPNLCANLEAKRNEENLEIWDGGECAVWIEERKMFELAPDLGEEIAEANGFGALADG